MNLKLSELSYQNRLIYLSVAFVIVLISTCFIAIVPTIREVREHNRLSDYIDRTSSGIGNLEKLRNIAIYYGSIVYHGSSARFEQQLLRDVSEITKINNSHIESFSVASRQKNQDWMILTTSLILTGKYVNFVKTIHGLEKQLTGSQIGNVRIYKERNPVTRVDQLYCLLHIKSIVDEKYD